MKDSDTVSTTNLPSYPYGRIAVLGAGSWGTALACVLARNGHDVRLWARRPELADQINKRSTNALYLPDVPLPTTIQATSDLATALDGINGHSIYDPPPNVQSDAPTFASGHPDCAGLQRY